LGGILEHHLRGVLSKLLAHDEKRLPIITADKTQIEIIEDLPAEDYHADKTRMSSTAIRNILRSPRHFLLNWQGLEDEGEEKDHFRIGRAAHLFLLEPHKFKAQYVVEPVHQGFTKDGKPTTSANALSVKEAKEHWLSQQKPDALIVSQQELDELVGMIEAVLEHPQAAGLLSNGVAETTIRWTDEETGVMCKARPDYLSRIGDELHLIDFKTTRDIRAGIFANDGLKMGYGTQLAFYHDGVVKALGRQPTSITIIAVEKKPPHEAVVYLLNDDWFEYGQRFYKHALKIYKKCRDTGKFPAFQNGSQMLSMPSRAQQDQVPEFDFLK